MEFGGQVHAPAALFSKKYRQHPAVSIEKESGWNQQLVWQL
jgi:hypothetical protein